MSLVVWQPDEYKTSQGMNDPLTLQLCPNSLAHSHGCCYETECDHSKNSVSLVLLTLPHWHSEKSNGGLRDVDESSEIAWDIRANSLCLIKLRATLECGQNLLPTMPTLSIPSYGTAEQDMRQQTSCELTPEVVTCTIIISSRNTVGSLRVMLMKSERLTSTDRIPNLGTASHP